MCCIVVRALNAVVCAVCVCVCVCVCTCLVSLTSCPEVCFPPPANSVSPACFACLRVWAGPCLNARAIADRKLPSGPSYTGKPLPDPTQAGRHLPPPSIFSPLLWLRFLPRDWPDSCSLTTPPRRDRLAAVPVPAWPRARHSGMWSP